MDMHVLNYLKANGYDRNILKGENYSILLYEDGVKDKPHDCDKTLFECIKQKARKENQIYSLRYEIYDRLSKIKIHVDSEIKHWESNISKPYYKVKSKPITKVQMFEMIRKMGFYSNAPKKDWHYFNGMIVLSEDVDINKIMKEVFNLAYEFPFLNLILLITNFDTENNKKDNEEITNDMIFEHTEIGVQISNRSVSILNRENAIKAYENF